jgi:hypothetical protein
LVDDEAGCLAMNAEEVAGVDVEKERSAAGVDVEKERSAVGVGSIGVGGHSENMFKIEAALFGGFWPGVGNW